MNEVDKWRAKVDKAVRAEQFEASPIAKDIIGWLNTEIKRLTERLVEDDALDTNEVLRASVRAELKAYRLIGQKLNLVKVSGAQAKATLEANGITNNDVESRTPEEIVNAAGL